MNSIGISKWANGTLITILGYTGDGSLAMRRADGSLAVDTATGPLYGVAAEEWIGEFLPDVAECMMASERSEAESESGTK